MSHECMRCALHTRTPCIQPTCKRAACVEVEQLTYGEVEVRDSLAFIVTVTLAMVVSAGGRRHEG